LRPQDASQQQQQQQQQQKHQQQALSDTVSAEPRRHFLKHQDSMKVSQDRIVKQLQLRQVYMVLLHTSGCRVSSRAFLNKPFQLRPNCLPDDVRKC
jgi:hypothetical protein